MDKLMQEIHIIDSHTGGEPTRLVMRGFPDIGGGSMADQREALRQQHDQWRRACLLEPRGSEVLVGALYCPPVSPDATCGVIFFNNTGYLGMCGHGTIGLIASLHYQGLIAPGVHKIDTPVGQVSATLHEDGAVTLGNVPAYRYRQQVAVDVPGYGVFHGDIAWGGNWFFLVSEHGMTLEMANVEALTAFTWAMLQALEAQGITGADGALIDHVELFADDAAADSRNFRDVPGQGLRPLALRHRHQRQAGLPGRRRQAGRRRLGAGRHHRQPVHRPLPARGRLHPPFITGRAYVTASSTLLIDPQDPFAWGI
jgi:4-hydroxyproline epimerase